MGPEDGSAEVLKAGVEVVKLTYDDALKPVAQEVGKALGLIGQTVNAMLVPLQGFVWAWGQIADYVGATVPRVLEERGVPISRIQTPDADIAVPSLEALRYSKLRENFARLIATSMDAEHAGEAHPAFVEILKQMTPDEARILEFLPRLGRSEPLVDLTYLDNERGLFILERHVGTLATDARCEAPERLAAYVDNLCRLGLTERPDLEYLREDWRYDRIRALGVVKDAASRVPAGAMFSIQTGTIGVTTLGDAFRHACMTRPAPGEA